MSRLGSPNEVYVYNEAGKQVFGHPMVADVKPEPVEEVAPEPVEEVKPKKKK
jgi:hypothetical protein